MRAFFAITLIFINMTLHSQNNLGLKLNGGISRVSNSFYRHSTQEMGWPVRVAPSGQVGLYYFTDIGEKSLLGAELLFNQIEGKEKIKLKFTDASGNTTMQSVTHKYTHLSYLSAPIYFGLRFEKWGVNFGGMFSYLLASSGRQKGQTTDGTFKWDNKYNKLNIDKYDYGLRIGFDYPVTTKFSVEGNFYQGINNIFMKGWAVRVQQLTVGVRYNLKRSENILEDIN